jgi:hypothetical protein|tara:strand:+ start:693 stop:1241 length:549 start_codon:yes stop_codon:yes gene_type:complete
MSILTEGLNYLDMENQMFPTLYIDEYAAKMGEDKDIITLSFMVKSYSVGEDLVAWFERGYNFVLDASVSEGELEPGKFLVFVEMDRRSWVPKKLYELVKDLQTLTGIDPKEWTVNIDDEDYPCEVEIMQDKMILNPNRYKIEEELEDDLNEMRLQAGLDVKPSHSLEEKDTYIKDIQAAAGL